jgi:hypothetical protein
MLWSLCWWADCTRAIQDSHAAEFRAVSYSAISGMVATVSIGTPPQEIQVAFDSGSPYSFLFSQETCPPFVSRCYDSSQSTTFTSRGIRSTLSDNNGVISGTISTDSVGQFTSFTFTLAESVSPTSARFRDVAGVIGMGKDSEYFRDSLIAVGESSVRRIEPEQVKLESLISLQTDSSDKMWICSSVVSFNTLRILGSKFRFDPGESDVLIPAKKWDSVISATKDISASVDWEGRLVVRCDLIPAFHVSYPSGQSIGLLRIPPSLLVVEKRAAGQADRQQCTTRFRFVEVLEHVVIGRVLTRRVGEIILNFQDDNLYFLPSRKAESGRRLQRSFRSPIPLIPIFDLNFIVTGENTIRFPVLTDPDSPGLVAIDLRGNSFIKFPHSWFEGPQLTSKDCGANLAAELSLDSVEITLEPGTTHEVRLWECGDSVLVTARKKGRRVRFCSDSEEGLVETPTHEECRHC